VVSVENHPALSLPCRFFPGKVLAVPVQATQPRWEDGQEAKWWLSYPDKSMLEEVIAEEKFGLPEFKEKSRLCI
jgi:hypothetical protein